MKYRHAESEGWYYQIDDAGNKSQSWTEKNRPGYYKEMMDWVAEGNEIEPFETADEIAEREAKEAVQVLENQEKALLNLIESNEYHLISRRFSADIAVWEAKLDEWAAQLLEVKAGKLVEIAGLPEF